MTENNSDSTPTTLGGIELATNSEPRCACVIVADRSGSMLGQPIDELNAGLQTLKDTLLRDPLACLRVEIALVSFDGTVTVDADFTAPQNFAPPTLSAGTVTCMGAAVNKSLDLLETRRGHYRAAGLSTYRPWMILLTDGQPTDNITEAAQRVREAEGRKRLAFFAVGVQGANMAKLAQLSLRPPLRLDGLRFSDLFQWLSASLSSVAVSTPGQQVPLPPPNWSTV